MILRILFALSVVLLGLAFHSRNHQLVTVDFYIRSVEIPLSWALVGGLIVGALCGILALLPRQLMLQNALHRERKKTAVALNSTVAPNPTSAPELPLGHG